MDHEHGLEIARGIHWVVTEYGAVNLHGKSLRERGEALISIAHPDFRAELRRDLAQARQFVPSRTPRPGFSALAG